MTDYQARFQQLLRELFQFDCADLDFGIYRIMNYKRGVIERFITQDLPEAISRELDQGALAEQSQAAKDLESARKKVFEALGDDALDVEGNLAEKYRETKAGREYLAAQDRAKSTKGREALEAAIYNHLYAFFSRYWQDGDVISKRRYSKRERYAIPYNGEEVTLYWANHDQYYVKTGEYFSDYIWKAVSGVTVHFKLQAADVEQNNVKGEKRFFLPRLTEIAWDETAQTLTIPFEFRPLTAQEANAYGSKNQQEAIIANAVEEIPKRLSPKAHALAVAALSSTKNRSDGSTITLLEHHLRQYTRRNTSDFFIHKDLKGFLSRELDFYLKNEVLHLDEMETAGEGLAEGWFQMMRLIKKVGGHIIDFLAQIEEFQKMLWEKRKFVTETFYCITVGHIPQGFYPEIATCEAQWEEWKALFHTDEEQTDLFTCGKDKKDRRIEFLKTHPTLVLDTRHFAPDFTDRLLAAYDNLDEMTDGLLVHSENWQGLSLLRWRYYQKVCCAYNDPPYNTEVDRRSGKFLYKDGYERSSWISLLYDRILQTLPLLGDNAPFLVSIDEHEFGRLNELLGQLLGTRIGVFTWMKKAKGSHLSQTIRDMTEFVLAYCRVKDGLVLYGEAAYSEKAQPLGKKTNARKTLKFPPNSVRTTLVDGTYKAGKRGEGDSALTFTEPFSVVDGVVTTGIAVEGPFVWTQAKLNEELALGTIPLLSRQFGFNVIRHDQAEKFKRPSTLLSSEQGIGTNETAFEEYASWFGIEPRGLYPKPVSLISYLIRARTFFLNEGLILDAFACTGTTGHAVINLNREDGGRRKFILVEMAQYFDTVLLPRIKKVTFTPEWKDGQPKRMATAEEAERSPRIVKVIRLESYEDALNNIAFDDFSGQQALQFEDYLLQYMLTWETRHSETLLNVEKLARPFSYQLHLHRDGETRVRPVDLPETFAYLLGLSVHKRQALSDNGRRYLVYRGETRQGRKTAVIWRETEGWTEADYERDRDFVTAQGLTDGADDVFVNGASVIPGARALEPVFKARMFAKVEG